MAWVRSARWAGAGLVAAAVCGSVVGAAGQAVAARRDDKRYPPPGRLVDVGGYRLHLNVHGDGSGPVVVLESGMGSFSSNWYWVQQELAATMCVVAYDRAGLGWSDRGNLPRDAVTIARELHTALEVAGIDGPYVLAGHSFGGLPVRAFAGLFPDETAGLVLVDASHPDQWLRWPVRHADRLIAGSQRISAALAHLGLLRLIDLSRSISAGLPETQVGELRARSALPGTSAVEAQQMDAWPQSRSQLATGLGDLPLVVLGVSEQPRGAATLDALQAELPALSTRSARRIVQGATHESLVAERTHARVVAEAIRAAAAGDPGRVAEESRLPA